MNIKPLSGLGKRIRLLRRNQHRLLRDVAGRCGFTVSLLSKIESGKVSPPVATLAKIAAALGVGMSDLLAESRANSTVFVPAGQVADSKLTATDKGYRFHLLAANRSQKLMQPFIFVAERGKVRREPMTHPGEEFVHILEGSVSYRVGNTTYTLGPGDSLYFDSTEEHDLEAITPRVKFLAVFTSHSTEKPEPETKS